MKKKIKVEIGIITCILVVICLASCKKNGEFQWDDSSTVNFDSSQISEGTKGENITSNNNEEESDSYLKNHRVISEQFVSDVTGDYRYLWVGSEIYDIKQKNRKENEMCIAVVTLTNVGETDAIKGGYTPVYLNIDEILIQNGESQTLKEGVNIICQDHVRWHMLDDGTYRIEVSLPITIPLAEIGAKYVVSLLKTQDDIHVVCLSFPFDDDNCYVQTKALGNEILKHISAETLWYFDINSEYYYEFWDDNKELLEFNKSLGNDVFDKNCVFWGMEMEDFMSE